MNDFGSLLPVVVSSTALKVGVVSSTIPAPEVIKREENK
jgi:hypothetical protein